MSHAPRRTCVACREVRDKRQLVRLVRLAAGTVVVDRRGTAPGRGAYVCRGAACVVGLAKGGRLTRAFRRPSAVDPALVTAAQGMAPSESMSMDHDVTSSGR